MQPRTAARTRRRPIATVAAFAAIAAGLILGGFALPDRSAAAEPVTIELKASAAKRRPPIPDGKSELAPHHVPTICSQGEIDAGEADAYAPTYGYYWSTNSKSWVARPRCYPRWGFLEMSPSLVVEPGKPVTMTAIPRDGSNSGHYGPITGSISWQYIGTVISGCGGSDISCTILPDVMATDEWQWLGFHVSMPKTFYIADPGEFCQGQHICAGATTNAWSFIGIPPKNFKGEIFGKVTGDDCSKPDCRPVPMAGVLVEATRSNDDELSSVLTDAKGEYRLLVPKGGYVVKPTLEGHIFEPFSTTAVVNPSGKSKGKTGPIDFNTCAAKGDDVTTVKAIYKTPCPTLDGDYKNDPKAPVSFSIKGENWRANAGPIVVSWGGAGAFKSVAGFNARKTFAGNFKLDSLYPFRRNLFDKYGADDDVSCWGTLRAKQGKVTVTHEYFGPKNATTQGGWLGYLVASNITPSQVDALGATRLKDGDLICENEPELLKAADAVTIIGRELTIGGGVQFLEIYMGRGAVDSLPITELIKAPKMTKCVEFQRGLGGFETHYEVAATKVGGGYRVKGTIAPGGCTP